MKAPVVRTNLYGLALLVPFGAIVSFPVWLAPAPIAIKDFGTPDVVRVLAVLFLVALLAERALEIFVGTWRSPGMNQLELVVHAVEHRLARLRARSRPDSRALRGATAELEDAKRQERQYRCVTRQIALWVGLTLGLLVSGVGLRALETLIDPNGWSASQASAFRLVDVVLTSGVIAGGSEGIHRIATVFDNFMSATAHRAKGTAA